MRRLAFPDADAHVKSCIMVPSRGWGSRSCSELRVVGDGDIGTPRREARVRIDLLTQWHWRRGAPTPAGGVTRYYTRYALHTDWETASDRQAGARGSAGRAIARLRRAVAAGAGMFEFCKGGVS